MDRKQELNKKIEELLDVKDPQEYAMRLAFLAVLLDKRSADPTYQYSSEVILNPHTGQKKTRVIIEMPWDE